MPGTFCSRIGPMTMHDFETKTDILIVGGGPVGIQARRTIKALAPEVRVTILRPEPY